MDQAATEALVLAAAKYFLYGLTVGVIIKLVMPSR